MADAKYSRYYTYIKPIAGNKFIKSSAPYIFSLITIIILVVFAIRPTITTISNLQKSIEENQVALEQLNQKSKNLSEAKRNLENIDNQTKLKISTAIPNKASITTVISSLKNSSAGQASVAALQIQPLTIIDTSPIQSSFKTSEVNFSYNLQGSYQQIVATLDNLRRSPRIISLDSVTISKQSGGSTVLSITGKAYFFR